MLLLQTPEQNPRVRGTLWLFIEDQMPSSLAHELNETGDSHSEFRLAHS
jgi:hypothetical protein